MGGRRGRNDHRLHERIAKGRLKIGRGLQLSSQRPKIGRLRSTRDHRTQLNLVAQVMKAAQVGHCARTHADQGHAQRFQLTTPLVAAIAWAWRAKAQTSSVCDWATAVCVLA